MKTDLPRTPFEILQSDQSDDLRCAQCNGFLKLEGDELHHVQAASDEDHDPSVLTEAMKQVRAAQARKKTTARKTKRSK